MASPVISPFSETVVRVIWWIVALLPAVVSR